MDTHNADCPMCNFPYARTVEFSAPYKVYDPNKNTDGHPSQYKFEFDDIVHRQRGEKELECEVVEGYCTHCDGHFFICPNCSEMNHIETHNEVFQCEFQCGYFYILHTDIDKKGMIHGWELEIVRSKKCQRCGEASHELSDSGLCEECEEHYGTSA